MKFKFNVLASVLALSAFSATSAYAVSPTVTLATNGASGNSTLIFSAWDDATGTGYSFDLSKTLTNLIGADTNSGSTGTANNTMAASGSSFSGPNFSVALPDWNLTAGSWNLVAADTSQRYRVLTTNADANWAGTTNSQIKAAGNNFNNYLSLGAASSTVNGITSSTSTEDAWYAGSSAWGDSLNTSGFAGSSVDLNASAYLFVAYQKSISTGALASQNGGVAALTDDSANLYTAYLSNVGGITYLNVAAVPEADTSAMMLAGLGLMGFIARRRNTKQA